MKIRDTNHVADFHDLCPRQSPRTTVPALKRPPEQREHHLAEHERYQIDQNVVPVYNHRSQISLSQISRHVEMVYVHDFHDMCPRLPRGKVSVKAGIMEFGLYRFNLYGSIRKARTQSNIIYIYTGCIIVCNKIFK